MVCLSGEMDMSEQWTQSKLQQLIDEEIEENLALDYKGADALQKTDGKKNEITKDVSAMANADGGILIYGISEYDEIDTRHLPEKLDAIDRTQYSKEWLEHVISNIRPRIGGIIIHPVDLNTGTNDVAYVVEIPKSTTAHQAKDRRYYLRYNFESVAMEDYQVRDVMHRRTRPDVSVRFKFRLLKGMSDAQKHKYFLRIFIENHGDRVVNHYQIVFSIPHEIPVRFDEVTVRISEHATITPRQAKGGYMIIYRSTSVLFPEEVLEVGQEMELQYTVDREVREKIMRQNLTLNWILYADDMPPKTGQIPFVELQDY